MAESIFSPRYEKGYDRTGEGIETFTGLLQGGTTDLVGGIVDAGDAVGQIAGEIPFTPTMSALSQLKGLADTYGSDALGKAVFGEAPTELRQQMRDDARLVGGALGLGELATAKAAKFISDNGIGPFIQLMKNRTDEVAVTPEGIEIPVPRTTDQPLPDTSVTEMQGGELLGRAIPEVATSRDRAVELFSDKVMSDKPDESYQAVSDIFEQTKKETGFGTAPAVYLKADGTKEVYYYTEFDGMMSDIDFGVNAPSGSRVDELYDTIFGDPAFKDIPPTGDDFLEGLDLQEPLPTETGYGKFFDSPLSDHIPNEHPLSQTYGGYLDEYTLRISEDIPNGALGIHNPYDKIIAVRADQFDGTDPNRFRSIMMHELQHLVQDAEGLPKGGQGFILRDYELPLRADLDNLRRFRSGLAKGSGTGQYSFGKIATLSPNTEMGRIADLIGVARQEIMEEAGMNAFNNAAKQQVYPGTLQVGEPFDETQLLFKQEVLDRVTQKIENKYQPFIERTKRAKAALGINNSAYENYKKIAGEAVAFNTQDREMLFESIREVERKLLKEKDPAIRKHLEEDLLELQQRTNVAPMEVFATRPDMSLGYRPQFLAEDMDIATTMTIPPQTKGGLASMAPRNEGIAPFAKLLGGNKPQRFYHGTTKGFKEFNPDAPYTFVSETPDAANFYAGATGNVRPVYLKDANFFDIDNPQHLKILEDSDWYKSNKSDLDDFTADQLGDEFDASTDSFLREIAAGDWPSFEETGLDTVLRDLGFDGFTTREPDKGNAKNYAVFNVNNIVSGIQKKAKGGPVRAGIGNFIPYMQ